MVVPSAVRLHAPRTQQSVESGGHSQRICVAALCIVNDLVVTSAGLLQRLRRRIPSLVYSITHTGCYSGGRRTLHDACGRHRWASAAVDCGAIVPAAAVHAVDGTWRQRGAPPCHWRGSLQCRWRALRASAVRVQCGFVN